MSWDVLCPSFLPAGLQLDDLRVYEETPGLVEVTFTDPAKGASVRVMQGNLGASLPASCARLASNQQVPSTSTSLGELQGTLYAPLTKPTEDIQNPFSDEVGLGVCIIAATPDGGLPGYAVLTEELDVDLVEQIAAGMRPVSP